MCWNGLCFQAKIVFQKETHYFGAYDDIRDAMQAKREGETAIFDTTLPFYEAWQNKVIENPAWAENDPVRVTVKSECENKLYLEMLPDLQQG